jgi:putative membrane protein
MGFGMGLFWPIIIIAVAYLIYRQIKSEKILAASRPVVRSAEDILSERYAKGELTREQYMQMKEDLKKTL